MYPIPKAKKTKYLQRSQTPLTIPSWHGIDVLEYLAQHLAHARVEHNQPEQGRGLHVATLK